MDIEIVDIDGTQVAWLASKEQLIDSVQDAIDLLGNAVYQGVRSVLLYESNLTPLFFDLATGFAGEILQKYANYQMKLTIVGDFEKYQSNSLKAFICECNQGGKVLFISDDNLKLVNLWKL